MAGKATSNKVSWKKVTQISILFDKGSHTVKTPSFLEKIRVSDAATTGPKFLSKVWCASKRGPQRDSAFHRFLSTTFSHKVPSLFPKTSRNESKEKYIEFFEFAETPEIQRTNQRFFFPP